MNILLQVWLFFYGIINIPARIVHGFLEGEYNELGGFYVVLNSDAHSWVEVYLDGTWVSFDPSPRPELLVSNSGFWQIDFRKIMESINFFWDRYILIYSGQDQLDAFSAVRDRYRELRRKWQPKRISPNGILESLTSGGKQIEKSLQSLLLLLRWQIALRLFLRRRRARKISRSPILFYQEMLSILERRGFIRDANSTPAEFMESIQTTIPQEVKGPRSNY